MASSGGDISSSPTNKLEDNNNNGDPPMQNLCALYLAILDSVLQYKDENGEFPNAESAELLALVLRYGVADICQGRLIRALVFLEESFRDFVRVRGINANFSTFYLERRFQLSKKIWGQDQLNQDQDSSVDHDQNIFDDYEGQNDIDTSIAILNALIQFKDDNNGDIPAVDSIAVIPDVDSVAVYSFLIDKVPQLQGIPQDRLVDKILILHENFIRVHTKKVAGDIAELDDSTTMDMYFRSRFIWGDSDEASIMEDIYVMRLKLDQEIGELQRTIYELDDQIDQFDEDVESEIAWDDDDDDGDDDENAWDDEEVENAEENLEDEGVEEDGYILTFVKHILSDFSWDPTIL